MQSSKVYHLSLVCHGLIRTSTLLNQNARSFIILFKSEKYKQDYFSLGEVWEDDRCYYTFNDIKKLDFWLKHSQLDINWRGEIRPINNIYHDLRVADEIEHRMFCFGRTYDRKNIFEIGGGLNGTYMLKTTTNTHLHIIEPSQS